MNSRATIPGIASPGAVGALREVELKRKGIQRGSLVCRGGVWHVVFRRWMPDAQGNVTYRSTSESTHRTNKREARMVADQIVAKANAPAECPRGTSTVTAFVETFFWPQHVGKLKKAGQIHYRTQWNNHVKPSIGDLQMNDVEPSLVQRLITQKHMAGMGASGLTHVRNVISKIFGFARSMGYFKGDLPTSGITLPRAERAERVDLSPEQVERILANMGGDENARMYRALVTLLSQSGLRIGEALGLEWEDLDFERAIILVRRQWSKGIFSAPKGGHMRATVMADALPAMAELKAATMEPTGLVFRAPGSPVGRPLDHHNFHARIWKPAAIKAGGAVGDDPFAATHDKHPTRPGRRYRDRADESAGAFERGREPAVHSRGGRDRGRETGEGELTDGQYGLAELYDEATGKLRIGARVRINCPVVRMLHGKTGAISGWDQESKCYLIVLDGRDSTAMFTGMELEACQVEGENAGKTQADAAAGSPAIEGKVEG